MIVHVYETCARIIVILFSLNALILILRLVIILAHPESRLGAFVLALYVFTGFVPSLVHLYLILLYSVFAKLADCVEVGVWVNTVLFELVLRFDNLLRFGLLVIREYGLSD